MNPLFPEIIMARYLFPTLWPVLCHVKKYCSAPECATLKQKAELIKENNLNFSDCFSLSALHIGGELIVANSFGFWYTIKGKNRIKVANHMSLSPHMYLEFIQQRPNFPFERQLLSFKSGLWPRSDAWWLPSGRGRQVDPEQVDLQLQPVGQAALQVGGVHLSFTCFFTARASQPQRRKT